MDRQEYLRYWRDVHAPLVEGLPGVRRYVHSTVRAAPGQAARYDTVDEIWVDDAAALDALLHCADYVRSALAGAGNLVDPGHCVRLQITDHVGAMPFYTRCSGLAATSCCRGRGPADCAPSLRHALGLQPKRPRNQRENALCIENPSNTAT